MPAAGLPEPPHGYDDQEGRLVKAIAGLIDLLGTRMPGAALHVRDDHDGSPLEGGLELRL